MTWPHFIFYSRRFIPPNAEGCAWGPFIWIDPQKRFDTGVHVHELEHVAQWWRLMLIFSPVWLALAWVAWVDSPWALWLPIWLLFGFFGMLGHLNGLEREVGAFRAQLRHGGYRYDLARELAETLANGYGFHLTPAQAFQRLVADTPLRDRRYYADWNSTPPPRPRDPYGILGVSPTATLAEIKKAYRRLVRRYHPDVSKEPDAEERTKTLNWAYELLTDPVRRSRYDQNRPDTEPIRAKPPASKPTPTEHGSLVYFAFAFVVLGVLSMGIYQELDEKAWHSQPRYSVRPLSSARVEPVSAPMTIQTDSPPVAVEPDPSPACWIRFKPAVMRLGEQSRKCYSTTGPFYRQVAQGTGILSSMGRVVSDSRKSKTGGDPHMNPGQDRCDWVKPSRTGVGVARFDLEGPGGKASCQATLTVVPQLPAELR